MVKISKRKKYSIFWILSFLIISIFSFSRDPFIDEITSIICSINFDECVTWDSQIPVYYFFLKPLTFFSASIELIRLVHAVIVSFSIIIVINAINKFKKLKTIEELFLLVSISSIPLFYSSLLARPYSLSLLFSSISIYYFSLYLKSKNLNFLKKSLLADSIGFLLFYFNILLVIPKFLYFYFFQRKLFTSFIIHSIRIFLIPIILLAIYILFFSLSFKVHESWGIVTKHYEEYKNYYINFLANFPIELYKEQTVSASDFSSFYSAIFKFFSQLLFFFPLLIFLFKNRRDEILFLYFAIFFTILIFNISFSFLTLRFLILSRQFIYLSLPLLFFLSLFLARYNKIFLIVLLPLTFVDYSIYRMKLIFEEGYIYFPIFEVMKYVKENEEILVTPYYCSQHFWYYEMFIQNKNLTIYDIHQIELDWYKRQKNETFSLRFWNTNKLEENKIIIPNHKFVYKEDLENITKIFIDIADAKEYCKEIIKEIKKTNINILICR